MSKLAFIESVFVITVVTFSAGLLIMGWVPDWTDFINSFH